MAVGAVVGSAIGTATAWALKFDKAEVSAGIYGFNSALVGIATLFFFRPGAVSIGLLVVGCVVAALVTWLMRRYVPFPTYTRRSSSRPGPCTSWVWPWARPRVEPGGPLDAVGFIGAVAHGVSQVMFQASIWTALLFLIGIALNDWRHASWVLVGSVVGMLVGNYHATMAREPRPREPRRSRPDRERRARAIRLQRDTGGRRPVPLEAVADPAAAGHAPVSVPLTDLVADARATGSDGTVRPGDLAGSGVRLARWKTIPRAGIRSIVTTGPPLGDAPIPLDIRRSPLGVLPMNLSPQERDKLLIFVAAQVAKQRKERGLKLNVPEATP